MTQAVDSTIVSALAQMTEYCQHMQKLLKNDQERFEKNDLTTIAESNKQKAILVEKMNGLINQFEMAKTEPSTNHLLSDIERLASNPQLQKTVLAFKTELGNCYQAVLTNNNIVSSNLQHLKNIWDKLIACHSDQTNVYDRTGNTTK
ncbi:MAG: flagellar export chaperone FlgN [Gammaproteobacteria bacterium]|nr:flagellar export chaperone FlgN [Gammaproteobacteria bacterium]